MSSFSLQDHEVQHHGEHAIEINEITNRNFDFEYYGWAFRVIRGDKPQFQMAITTAGLITESDREALYAWGLQWIRTTIDGGQYEPRGDYCFEWARGLGDPTPSPVDCRVARQKPSVR